VTSLCLGRHAVVEVQQRIFTMGKTLTSPITHTVSTQRDATISYNGVTQRLAFCARLRTRFVTPIRNKRLVSCHEATGQTSCLQDPAMSRKPARACPARMQVSGPQSALTVHTLQVSVANGRPQISSNPTGWRPYGTLITNEASLSSIAGQCIA